MEVGFVSLTKGSKSIFDDAVGRSCEGNKIRMLSNEERAHLYKLLYHSTSKIDDFVTELAKKYNCLFIDEISMESYHSD